MTTKTLFAVFAMLFALAACGPDTKSGDPTTKATTDVSRPDPSSPWSAFTDPNKNGYSIRVFFDTDQYDLKPEARKTIEAWAAWLKAHPEARMLIEGNCDERGTREYNLGLGARRANAVRNYLVALGVPSRSIRTVSYGKERPIAPGSTEEAWAQNRNGTARPSGPGA